MPRGPTVLLLALAAALLAGCAGESRSPVDATPYLSAHPAEPGQPVEIPLFLNSTFTFKQNLTLRVESLPQGWTWRTPVGHAVLPGHQGRLALVEITPAPDALPGETEIEVLVGDTRAAIRLNLTPFGEPARPGTVANLTWVHLDRNGTVLAWSEPLLRGEGLKHHPDATRVEGPLRVYLGGPDAPETPVGLARLPPEVEARLLLAKEGATVLAPGDQAPDPTLEGRAEGGFLLLRILDVQAPESP